MSVTHLEREYSPDGSVRVIDDRRWIDVVAWQIASIKGQAGDRILAVAPEYTQRNAALGILSLDEFDRVCAHISTVRRECDALEARIAAVKWDGRESTRAFACDAVQAVTW